jgi:hypothetical protein
VLTVVALATVGALWVSVTLAGALRAFADIDSLTARPAPGAVAAFTTGQVPERVERTTDDTGRTVTCGWYASTAGSLLPVEHTWPDDATPTPREWQYAVHRAHDPERLGWSACDALPPPDAPTGGWPVVWADQAPYVVVRADGARCAVWRAATGAPVVSTVPWRRHETPAPTVLRAALDTASDPGHACSRLDLGALRDAWGSPPGTVVGEAVVLW